MYLWVLFVHLLGVSVLAAATGLEAVTMARVLGAAETGAVRAAVTAGRIVSGLFPVASLALIASGVALVAMSGRPWFTPWLMVSAALVAAMVLAGPLVVGRRMGALAAAAFRSESVTVDETVDAARRDPAMHAVSGLGSVSAVIVLLEMTVKPDLTGSLVAGAAAVIGGIALGLARTLPRRAHGVRT